MLAVRVKQQAVWVFPLLQQLSQRRQVLHGRALGVGPVAHALLLVDAPEVQDSHAGQPA